MKYHPKYHLSYQPKDQWKNILYEDVSTQVKYYIYAWREAKLK